MRLGNRLAALVVIASLTLGGCAGSSAAPPPTTGPVSSTSSTSTTTISSTTTTTIAPPTSTTTPPATTSTAVPTPAAIVWPALEVAEPGVFVTPSGIVAPIIATEGNGYRVRTPCGNETSARRGDVLTGTHVVLDPGHGGSETGAIGPNGLREADVNLAVAKVAAQLLNDAGASVVLTRTNDSRVTLATRAEIGLALRARAMVSIHHNAEPDGPSVKPGSETWYQYDNANSRRLAGLLYEEMVAALTPFDAAWQSDTDAGAKIRLNERGGDYYGILRNSAGVPTVLAEFTFISNPSEEALLRDPAVIEAEGRAVFAAVTAYLTTDAAGSGYVDAYPRTTPAGSGGGADNCVDPVFD